MLICHKRVASNEAAVLQACHMSDMHTTSAVRGCVPLGTSSSLIYHLGFSNTITLQRRLTTTAVADAVVVPMKTACMPSK